MSSRTRRARSHPARGRRIAAAFVVAMLATDLGAPALAHAAPPEASPRFVQVEAGASNGSTRGAVLAVTDDGRLFAWGRNLHGALGLGPGVDEQLTPTEVPLPLDASDRVVQVSLGSEHALALTLQGKVLAWGSNLQGELGLGDTDSRFTPTLIGVGTFPWLSFARIVQVAAGGLGHSLALSENGQVYAWGANSVGQLGDGAMPASATTPRLVITGGATHIAAGAATSFAVEDDGDVLAWGANDFGQLGIGVVGAATAVPTPLAPFPGLGTARVVQLAAGWSHAAALTDDGAVYVWGDDNVQFHPLGLGGAYGTDDHSTPSPVRMATFPAFADPAERIVAIDVGDTSAGVLTSTGAIYTWGDNAYGQLGLGDNAFRSTPTLVTVPAFVDNPPVHLSVGDGGMVAATGTGGVYGVGIHGGSVGDATIAPPTWGVSSFTNIRLAALTGTVALSATPVVGQSVQAVTAGWNTGAEFSYQWRIDAVDIPGATASSYTPSSADAARELDVVVSATAQNYGPASVGSAALAVQDATAPGIVTTALPELVAGRGYLVPIEVTGTAPVSFTANLPDGLEMDAVWGEIYGTVERADSYPVSVTATNAAGSVTRDFTLVVVADALARVELSALPASPFPGDTVTVTAMGFDQFDNLVGDVTSHVRLSSSVATDEVDDERVTVSTPGVRTLSADYGEGRLATLVVTVATPSTQPPVVPPVLPEPPVVPPVLPAAPELLGDTGVEPFLALGVAAALLIGGGTVLGLRGASRRN